MARIRFISTQIYETGAPGKGPRFPAGFVLDSSDVPALLNVDKPSDDFASGFLRRWISRNAAEYVGEDVDPSDPAEIVYIDPGRPNSVVKPFGTARHGRASAGVETGDDIGSGKSDLGKLTRAELDAMAADLGIDLAGARNKDDVIALLQAADKPAE